MSYNPDPEIIKHICKKQSEKIPGGLLEYGLSREEIEQILRDNGAGSHLIVGINRHNRCGHWFNVFFDGRDVHIIDGQMGEILDWSYDYGNVSSWEVLRL